jgi:uncharacterized protein
MSQNPAPAPVLDQDSKNWGMAGHLAALAGFVIPFGNIIGPLVVYLMKKGQNAYAETEAKESLNFQITVSILAVPCFILVFLLIGIPLLLALGVASLVFIILGGIKANGGTPYRYPVNFRLVK